MMRLVTSRLHMPLPASSCSCFKDVSKSLKSGNLGIVKSVLKDPSCVSRAAYTEVSTRGPPSAAAPGSTSLAEVSGKLQCRFACNAAAVDGSKAVASDVKFCQELEKIVGAAPSPAVPSSAADIASLLKSAGQDVSNAGAPLCAFAQALGSQGHYWLLLQHVVFSGEASDGVADCDCVVKQDSKDARLVFVKEKLKPWKGKTLADALPLVATAAVHLAELAQVHGAASTSSHAAVCVQLPDSSVDSKFLPIKLDPLLVSHRALIDRCCSKMWAGVRAPGKRQLLLLHGISEVGKTCAAVAAIYQLQRLSKDAKCTMLIQLMSGHSAAAVRGKFVKFGRALSRRLRLDESTKDDEVIEKLTAHLKVTRYAIFADDANDEGLKELMQLLPVSSEGCTIIATSRLMSEGQGRLLRELASTLMRRWRVSVGATRWIACERVKWMLLSCRTLMCPACWSGDWAICRLLAGCLRHGCATRTRQRVRVQRWTDGAACRSECCKRACRSTSELCWALFDSRWTTCDGRAACMWRLVCSCLGC